MRLDHLLSKENGIRVRVVLLSSCQGVHAAGFDRAQMPCLHEQLGSGKRCHMANGRARAVPEDSESAEVRRMDVTCGQLNFSGGDALRGNTRSHPEHDG